MPVERILFAGRPFYLVISSGDDMMFTFESEEHAREIQAWLTAEDRDSQPMPEPCTTTWCNFCQNWYGRDFSQRRAVWEQRNAERDKPRLAAFRATHPRLFESTRA